jgi:hypothetical protein
MKRIVIRNPNSPNRLKPRVFDAIIDGEDVFLEVKGTKANEVVPLDAVLEQIETADRKLNTIKLKSTEL